MSGVDKGDAHDSGPFGDVRKLITDTFIRQMYLKRDKVVLESGGHEERYQYQWGTRALHEFPKKDILDSVANVNRGSGLMKNIPLMFDMFCIVIDNEQTDDNVQETAYGNLRQCRRTGQSFECWRYEQRWRWNGLVLINILIKSFSLFGYCVSAFSPASSYMKKKIIISCSIKVKADYFFLSTFFASSGK